jgi:hypothetical protein
VSGVTQSGFVRVIGEHQLDLLEAIAVPAREPDQEGQRAGGSREAGCLGVEAHQRCVGRRLARESREPLAIERQVHGRHDPAYQQPATAVHDLGRQGSREASGEQRAPAAGKRCPGRGLLGTGR